MFRLIRFLMNSIWISAFTLIGAALGAGLGWFRFESIVLTVVLGLAGAIAGFIFGKIADLSDVFG